MFRNLLVGAALLAFTASLTAQTQVPVYKGVQPKHAGVYRMDTGLDRSAVASRAGTRVIYNNTIASGYYSVPGAGQEWIDEGGLMDTGDCLGTTDQINGFEWIYCSSEPDPAGNALTYTINFYDEYDAPCGGPPSWPAANCSYDIGGLPAGGATGNLQCWIVTVDLEGGFECSSDITAPFRTEGDASKLFPWFGWAGIPDLNNTGPWLRRGGYLRENAFTWYDPTSGLFNGCFWFGGFPFASFSMKMFGADETNCQAYNEAGNAVGLSSTGRYGPGAAMVFTITNPQAGQDYYLIASLGTDSRGLPGGSRLLVSLPQLPPTPLPMAGGSLGITIPGNAPPTVYVQAACVRAGSGPPSPGNLPVDMSNGLCYCR